MSISIPEFWKCAIDGRLLTLQQCQELGETFGHVKGAATQSNALTLAEWLVAEGTLTRYQSKLLLSGQRGPFFYGPYKVLDRVRHGPLAGVRRAVHAPTGHPVMLFFLSGPQTSDKTRWKNLIGRAGVACGIVHPNVSRCYRLVDALSYKFIVLDDLRGESIAERLAGFGPCPPAEAARIVRQAALGLARLHESGLVHGEVHATRLWVEPTGNVRLLQAPLHRMPFSPPEPFNWHGPDPDGALLAAAEHAAPELIQQGRAPDVLADVYALGCSFYQLLTGRVPFADGDVQQKLHAHATRPIQPLEHADSAAAAMMQIVTYMMAKNPGLRYQSAAAVVDALTPLVDAAVLNIQPEAPPATQAAFEAALDPRLAGKAAPPSPPAAAPAVETGQVRIVTEKDRRSAALHPASAPDESFPEVAVSTATVAAGSAAGSGPGGDGKSAADGSVRSAHRPAGRRRKNAAGLWIASATAALALVAAVALIGARGCTDGSGGTSGTTAQQKSGSTGKTSLEKSPPGSNSASEIPAKTNQTDVPGKTGVSPPVAKQPLPPGGGNTVDDGTGPVTVEAIDNDGSTLWMAPTSAAPIDLSYVAPGAQAIIVARPSDMLAHPQARSAIEALGPFGGLARQVLGEMAGVPLEEIEQLVIGVQDDSGQPGLSLVVRLKSARTPGQLLAAWGQPAALTHAGKTFYQRGGKAYYLVDSRTFAVAEPSGLADLIDSGGRPLLTKEMEDLRTATHSDRHLTILLRPSYLRNRGHLLFQGQAAPLAGIVDSLLGLQGEVMAALVSVHFDENFFAELRLYGALDKRPDQLAREMQQRLNQVPADVKNFVRQLAISQYSRGTLFDYPRMIEETVKAIRADADERQAVLRLYLPGGAGAHLVQGSELALLEAAGGGSTTVLAKQPAKTVAEKLREPISLAFPRRSLEQALADFSGESGIEVQLIGKDLQQDGITRNQQINDFRAENKPAAEVLEMLLLLANPDKTAKSVSDPAMKLVYVVKPGAGGGDVVHVTTRDAAAKRKDRLPPEFERK